MCVRGASSKRFTGLRLALRNFIGLRLLLRILMGLRLVLRIFRGLRPLVRILKEELGVCLLGFAPGKGM